MLPLHKMESMKCSMYLVESWGVSFAMPIVLSELHFISQMNTTPPANYYDITSSTKLSHCTLTSATYKTTLWGFYLSQYKLQFCGTHKYSGFAMLINKLKVTLSPSAISLEYVGPNFKRNRSDLIKNSLILNIYFWTFDKSQIAAIALFEIFLALFPMIDHIL